MRPASEVERRRCSEEFAALCRIRSVTGEEAELGRRLSADLRGLGLEVDEPDAAGNVLARAAGRSPRTVLLCAHLDTVPHEGVVEPVCEDGGWVSAGDTILGADNKAAIAVLLAVGRRAAIEGSPVGLELLLTTGEETGLHGAQAFDAGRLRADVGFVFDHASPIGEIIVAAPTAYRLEAHFRGSPAHAGMVPEEGRSAISAAARAIGALRVGRLDEETTANVGSVIGGVQGVTNVIPEHASFVAEARSLSEEKIEALVAEMVDHVHDAANEPVCECDVDLVVERKYTGYRLRSQSAALLAAETALRERGYQPRRVPTGGGSDANVFNARGLECLNLANGTERPHRSDERVSLAALEGMLDVTYALLDQLAQAA